MFIRSTLGWLDGIDTEGQFEWTKDPKQAWSIGKADRVERYLKVIQKRHPEINAHITRDRRSK